MKKKYLTEHQLNQLIAKCISTLNEQEEDDDDDYDEDYDTDNNDNLVSELKNMIDSDEPFSDSTITEIEEYNGPMRRFRGSIYIDGLVPETEDKEFDRAVGLKILEYYANNINASNYVGGLGFKNSGNLLNPYDNMDF